MKVGASEAEPFWTELLRSLTRELAAAHGLSAYDGAYSELALRRALPLATLDAGLLAAMKDAGVPRAQP